MHAMHSSEVRLNLFHGAPLEYRFASPRWRQAQRPATWDSLLTALAAVNPRRCRRLLFGDGPLAHPRFFELVAEARARVDPGLAVETDGRSLAADGVVERLAEAGVEKVFAVLGGGRPRVHDQVMQDPGAFLEAIEGVRRVAASKLELYVVMPVTRWSERDIEPFLHWLVDHARPKGFLLALPVVSRVAEAARGALSPTARRRRWRRASSPRARGRRWSTASRSAARSPPAPRGARWTASAPSSSTGWTTCATPTRRSSSGWRPAGRARSRRCARASSAPTWPTSAAPASPPSPCPSRWTGSSSR
jgi:hypothetical protein